MRSFFILFAACLCASIAPCAVAQSPAASDLREQQLLRQRERDLQLRRQLEPASDVRLQPAQAATVPRLPAQESPCFLITRIELAGDMADRFAGLLGVTGRADDGSEDKVIGRCIGSAGIGIVMRRLQNEVVRQGYVTTRVLAGPQDLATGVLTLTLMPGRVRTVRFAAGTSTRATQWNAVPLQQRLGLD